MFWLNSVKSSVRENISKSEKKTEMWSQVLLKSLQYNVQLGSTWIELNCVLLDPIWTISYQFPRMGGSTWGVDDDDYVYNISFICLMTYSFDNIVCLIMKRRIQPYIEILINWRSRLNMELGHLLQLDRVSMGTNPLYLSNSSKHYHHHSFNGIDLECAWQI